MSEVFVNDEGIEVVRLRAEDWPEVAPTEILPGLWMGGIADDGYVGDALGDDHYAFDSPYEIIVTLYGDAQPAPWGVIELRYGFPDDELEPDWALRCVALADFAYVNWRSGREVLVRCERGINRSGLVTALILMRDARSAEEAVALLRERRGQAVLINTSFERWLIFEAAHCMGPHDAAPPRVEGGAA